MGSTTDINSIKPEPFTRAIGCMSLATKLAGEFEICFAQWLKDDMYMANGSNKMTGQRRTTKSMFEFIKWRRLVFEVTNVTKSTILKPGWEDLSDLMKKIIICLVQMSSLIEAF